MLKKYAADPDYRLLEEAKKAIVEYRQVHGRSPLFLLVGSRVYITIAHNALSNLDYRNIKEVTHFERVYLVLNPEADFAEKVIAVGTAAQTLKSQVLPDIVTSEDVYG